MIRCTRTCRRRARRLGDLEQQAAQPKQRRQEGAVMPRTNDTLLASNCRRGRQWSYVDPIGNHATSNNEELVETGEKTTNSTRDVLGDVKRHKHRCATDTETVDEPVSLLVSLALELTL